MFVVSRAPELSLTDAARCAVLLLATDRVDEPFLAVMRARFEARSGRISCIVIATEIAEKQLAVMAGLGLIALLHRGRAGSEQIREAVALTRLVRPPLPESVFPLVLHRFREAGEEAVRAGTLSDLEARVLHLHADGLTSAEVGKRLGLPRAAINRIVLRARNRLGLRSRTHAVAYAVRRELRRSSPRTGLSGS